MGLGLVSQGGWPASSKPSIEGLVNSITGSQAAPLLLLLGGIIGLLVSLTCYPSAKQNTFGESHCCQATQSESDETASTGAFNLSEYHRQV